MWSMNCLPFRCTCGACTAYPSWHMSSTPFYKCFSEVCVVQITYLHVRRLVLWSTFRFPRGPGWLNELDYLTTHTSLSPIRRGLAPGFVNYKKGALDSQPQVIKFTSCFPMVSGSLRVLRLLPPLNLVAMI